MICESLSLQMVNVPLMGRSQLDFNVHIQRKLISHTPVVGSLNLAVSRTVG